MTEIREKLGWFDTQLHLQIRDEEIERGGGSLVTYFDTSDVRDAVLGLQAFFALDKTFDLALFRPRRVLVRCLATSGWLAKFEMLPPHQSEFLSLLNLDFGFGKDSGWVSTERVQEFMNRLGLREILDEARVSLTKLNKGELVGFVKRRALSAETLFRALQCARGGNWVVRLASLRKRGLIGIGPSGVDYGEVIASKHFGALRDAFNHRRPDKAVNNFADAAALSILLLQVEAFSRGLSKCLPRLFDSRGTFREVLDGVGHGIPDSLVESVQGADYFIFRAAFRPPVDVGRSSEEGGSRLDDLLSLRGQIQEILGAQSKLTAEDVDNIKVSGRPLTKVIDDLQRLSFLENVWLPFHAETDVEAMVKELDDLARQESTRTFKDGLEAAIKEVKEAIRLNVLEYQRLDSLWRELERGFQRIRARVSARGKMIDVFRDFALLRFSFPRSTRQAIVNVVEGLLAEGEQVQRDARVSVIDAFFKGRKDRGDVDTLALAASVLWIAELDSYVEVLLGGNSRLPHFSLQIVYAASIFRRRIGIGIGRTLLSSLESLYRETQDRRQKAELAVGIAYLKYHYWRSIGGVPGWNQAGQVAYKAEDIKRKSVIRDAIRYAREASDLLGRNDARRAYALNQYLFYLVEGGTDLQRDEMIEAAGLLTEYMSNVQVWQYRFDDTLARYYHRLATLSNSDEEWKGFMREAKDRIDEAISQAMGDEVVAQYRTQLINAVARGFRAKMPNRKTESRPSRARKH